MDAEPDITLADSFPSSLPRRGTGVLRYAAEDGRVIEFLPHLERQFDVRPLSHEEFVAWAMKRESSFRVEIRNASAPTSMTGLEVQGPLTVTAEMVPSSAVPAFGLVDGGWLPMPWAHRDVAWLDRNLVIRLEKLQLQWKGHGGEVPDSPLVSWLGLDSYLVSPMLFALEGGRQRPPTDWELRIELNRAFRQLSQVLPSAKVQRVGASHRRALRGMLLDGAEVRGRHIALLVSAARLVHNKVAVAKRRALEDRVIKMANELGVQTDSLVVLSLLSCIYDSGPNVPDHRAATPGRAVLKPGPNYSEEDAYNALADLYALELLHNAHALFANQRVVLYTADVGMASMWTATQPCTRQATHLSNGMARTMVNFRLDQGLFPALLPDDVGALSRRLAK